MNTQMDRPRGHGDPHDLTSTGLQHSGMEDERHDETEHHDEKKSVLKKVKEKAKKIKDTIKCGVGHGHDHDEENDDNEMVTDRNVHGAPAAHGITTGNTDATRLHGQVHLVTEHEETLGGSRVGTRLPVGHDNQVHGLMRPHVLDAHSGGTHRPKLGGILEKDPHTLKNVGDVNPASHQTDLTDPTSIATHGITSSRQDKARQHGTNIGERTPIGGRVPVSNPSSYQVFDTTTTQSVPGQQKILDWSTTNKQTPLGLRHKPAVSSHAGGTDRPKVVDILEKDARAPKNIGEDVHRANRQSDLTYPASGAVHGITTSKEDIARQHRTKIGERTAIGSQVPVSNPGAYQTFDTTTTHYVPRQEETLGWSRIDKRTPLGSDSQSHGLRHTPVLAGHHSGGTHSTGDLGVGHKPKLGGILERDPHASKNVAEDVRPANYQPNVTNLSDEGNIRAPAQDIGIGLGQGGTTARRHEGYLEERGTTEGASNIPGIKPVEHHTFDKDTTRYIPGHRETLGARTEERPYATKNTPDSASLSGHFGTQVTSSGQKEDYGRLGEVLERSTGLEKDPHAPRDIREIGRAEYHQAKVTDPLGRGSEEIGVTPILHQLGKMNIHGETTQNPGFYENPAISTGSHDKFSPEPITPETSTFLQPQESKPQSHTPLSSSHQGFQDESNREHGSNYTDMISSAASELAHKAKVVTNSVTSKLGYSGTSETSRNTSTVPLEHQPVQGQLNSQPVSGGYGETSSTVSVAVADKVSKAKDAVASKLGYSGEAYEAQSDESNVGFIGDYGMNDEAQEASSRESNAGSIGDYGKKVVSTVQEKIAPVYEKVAGLGSTVASKVRGSSGTEGEMESTLEPDNGVSVKEYLVEKLKPGEEDQALSKVITEALPLHKEEEEENEIGLGQGDEMVIVDDTVLGLGDEAINVDEIGLGQGDEVMEVEIEERVTESGRETTKTKVVITGQVTESEEMPHHLCKAEETSYDDDNSEEINPGKSVMERIKDAAGFLFSKSGETGEQSVEGNERAQSSTMRELQHEHNLNAREAGLQ
ncbi:uncharacterized protein LOC141656623 [Silene latifolia]|uniref:uncharacterized protein LOC141656623 n=1 Tax=Silene latifolia TaxID=37657 RepID=UPI003D76C0B8